MFKKHKDAPKRRKKNGFSIVRSFISLIMISLLSLGVYAAYKSFSGIDPLKLDPKTAIHSVTTSDSALELINNILSFSPTKIISKGSDKIPVTTDDQSAPAPTAPDQTAHTNPTPDIKPKFTPKPSLDFRFAIVADSENDTKNLSKALSQAKSSNAQFVVGLGDYTEVGTVDELSAIKKDFDAAALPYYTIPGDHDLWDSRNRGLNPVADFRQVFGVNYQSFSFHNVEFLLVDNSDNYTGIDKDQGLFIDNTMAKVSSEKPKLSLAFVSTPLYHPSSDHYMGKVEPSLRIQASELTHKLKVNGFSEVFGGDTHFYSDYTEPKEDLKMNAVGAITAERNLELPRFVMVDVYSDGSYNITDTEVK